ncbi:MAG: M4 family metallopeptidase [Bacteroidales bacterium]|nr:M4 family metallopeptidase [Bacteroidales bacterium]
MKKRILTLLICFWVSVATYASGSFWLDLHNQPLAFDDAENNLGNLLGTDENSTFVKMAEYADELGITHSIYQQYYLRIPVKDAIIIIHSQSGYAISVNGNALTAATFSPRAPLAQNLADDVCKQSFLVAVETAGGVLYRPACKSVDAERMLDLYIDSENGDTLQIERKIYGVSADAYTLYSDWQQIECTETDGYYFLADAQRNIITKDATENAPLDYRGVVSDADYQKMYERYIAEATLYATSAPYWAAVDEDMNEVPHPALDAHWGTEMAYDFYLGTFGRKSFDDKGHPIFNIMNPAHDNRVFSSMPNNAAAVIACEPYFIFYGLGNGSSLCPFVSLDIVAHEYTHLVTRFNQKGGIGSSGEAGSLNESFSDIMAMGVKRYATGVCDWQIGGDILKQFSNLRNLSDPNASMDGHDPQPDTYKGLYWKNTADKSKEGDYGGVHANDGVQNFWFYLLSEGGTGINDNGDSYEVQGIGFDDALKIVYRNMMHYITPSSGYFDAFRGSASAARDLFSIDSEQYKAVLDAWHAVGIGEGNISPEKKGKNALVFSEKNTIFIKTALGRTIKVCDAAGRMIFQCTASAAYTTVELDSGGVYIVTVDGEKHKVAVN